MPRKLKSAALEPSVVQDQISNLVAGAPTALNTLNELAAALGNDANYAATVTTALGNINTSLNSKAGITTSTGALLIPSGTTAQRPTSPSAGYSRYNTDTSSLEFYNGSIWISTNLIPNVNSVNGTIYTTYSASLAISVTNATEFVTVRFSQNGITIADVTNVAITGGNGTITVPSSVYNQVGGSIITISVLNNDGTPSANTVNKTIIGLPSGGTITSSGNYRIHTFTSSSDLIIPSNFSKSVEYLLVAGGGGGGCDRAGGGGAGGMIEGTFSVSAGTYQITIGAGGSGSTSDASKGSNGQNSVISTIATTIGGGGGGSENDKQGANGGSGGGSSYNQSSAGSGTSGQGNAGFGFAGDSPNRKTGGGGGKGAAATDHNGGNGSASSISGTSVYYAGGGGGGETDGDSGGASGITYRGNGGLGGGGIGGTSNLDSSAYGVNGETNKGGGGGGGGGNDAGGATGPYAFNNARGGNGGSGIAIIRYQL